MPQMGERRTRKDGKAYAEWSGSEWIEYPLTGTPGSNAPSPGDEPTAPLTPGSEARGRLALGLGPSINAQRNLYSAEGWGEAPKGAKARNPYNKEWGAKMLSGVDIPIPFTAGAGGQSATFSPFDTAAKVWGGQTLQDYEQAAKSFESAFLPILSGAAVTPSEGKRMIAASLPELGDTPATLARKATNRAMMINGAADLMGKPRPFPKVGTMDLSGTKAGSQPRPGQASAAPGAQVPPAPQRKAGQTYQTPMGPLKWTGTGLVQP